MYLLFYSGCNYYINSGSNEYEPKGTATSMHDCAGCDKLDMCILKKKEEVWPFNKDIEQKMNLDWQIMLQNVSKSI